MIRLEICSSIFVGGVLGTQNPKLFKSLFALKICVFRESPHHHPVLYLRGVKKTDIAALLDFMYHGEARFCFVSNQYKS